jgi:DNA processing protein
VSEISQVTGRLLALSMLRGIGPATLKKISRLPNFESLSLDQIALQFPANATALRDESAWRYALEEAEKQVEAAVQHSARILSPFDNDYPQLLAGTKDDPFLLFIRGYLSRDATRSVAVIGTREPTSHGEVIAKRITKHLVENDWSIVSGLAKGCDALAHQAALDNNGHTVAVLAHGLHTVAPKANQRLAEEILSNGGALVSEYRFGVEPRPEFFVKRDRIQAGMSQGVVMIQSDHKGGSLHASRASLEYGRWLAVPYPTGVDRDNREPKVQANIIFAEGSEAERSELLRCPVKDLERVIVLRSKEDYSQLRVRSVLPDLDVPPFQGGLI